MAGAWRIPLFCCLVAAWACQVTLAAGREGVQTRHGLVLPSSMPRAGTQQPMTYSQRQELEVLRSLITDMDEQEQPQHQDLSHAAQPALDAASKLSQQFSRAVQHAQAVAESILMDPATFETLARRSAGAAAGAASDKTVVTEIVLDGIDLPLVGVQQAAAGAASAAAKGAGEGMHMALMVSSSSGPAWSLPSWLHGSRPSWLGSAGRNTAAEEASRQQLAAMVTESVRQSAEQYLKSSSKEDVVILDLTVDGDATDIIAAATAGAAAAAASAASSGQHFDGLELQMDVTEQQPFYTSRFCLFSMLLLSVQLLLCLAVALLWGKGEEGDALEEAPKEAEWESDDDDVRVAVVHDKDQKQQPEGRWASLAEEGQGLYEKLLP